MFTVNFNIFGLIFAGKQFSYPTVPLLLTCIDILLCLCIILVLQFALIGGPLDKLITARRNVYAIIKLLSTAADAVLSVKNLFNVTKEVTNWYTLGLQLDIPTHKLQSIQHDHRTLENSKHEMLHFWVHSDPEASWGKLATAVERMEFRRISERIRDNYIPLSQRSVAMAASTRGILLVTLNENISDTENHEFAG